MKSILDYINESSLPFKIKYSCDNIIDEDKIYKGKCLILTSPHSEDRKKERKVNNKEIISAILGAWDDLNTLYAEGNIRITKKNGIKSKFLICDARRSQDNCVCVIGIIEWNKLINGKPSKKLIKPVINILTVFKGQDFAALRRKDGKNRDDNGNIYFQHKIFLMN